ncbi:MAG: M23 family metallopeptidase [Bacteroidales bacterium]|nr:M23 family metallopeptidase [Bacteroidales bacterium]
MNIKTSIILVLSIISLSSFKQGYADDKISTGSIRVVIENDKQTKFAANSPIRREIELLDSLILEDAIAEEEEMFPADDLYASWTNERVNPYKGVQIPDSFTVDCSSFIIPVEGKITSRFGPRRYRQHKGIDLKVQVGDTIVAAFDGKVRIRHYERKGYGYYLVIRHNNGLETVYGHLSKFLVKENDIIKAGQPIALGGNTGRSTGSHLHFETRFLGIAINPEEIIDFQNFVPHKDSYTFVKRKATLPVYGTPNNEGIVYHKVKQGDSLYVIAKRYRTTVTQLCKLNKLSTSSVLRIGQSIRCN